MVDGDQGTETPQGPGIMEKLGALRAVQAKGGDILEAAKGATVAKPNGAAEAATGERGADGGTAVGEGADQSGKHFDRWGEIPPDVHALQNDDQLTMDATELEEGKIRELLKTAERGEVPPGMYRDEAGRLRDEITHRFITTDPGEETEEAAASGTADELEVELPGRREGDPPVKFKAPDKEIAERLRQATNEGMRRRQYNEAVSSLEERERSQQMFFDALKTRPADVLVEQLRPEVRGQVVERLLAAMPDEEFAKAIQKATGWARSPESRRVAAIEAENASLKAHRQAQTQAEADAASSRFIQDIGRTMVDMMPDEWDQKHEDSFVKYALTQLEEYAGGGGRVDAATLPALLDELGVLLPFGLDRGSVEARIEAARGSTPPANTARPAAKARPAAAAGGKAKRAGTDVRERVERRRNATASAPAGAGAAPAGGINPPPNQTVAERLAWAKKKFGFGRSRG